MIYKKKKILFIGTVEFSYKALSTLIENKFEIVRELTESFRKKYDVIDIDENDSHLAAPILSQNARNVKEKNYIYFNNNA